MPETPSKTAISAWIQLHRAHRSLLEAVEQDLKQAGLPPLDWYDVLLELHRERPEGLRQFELCEKVLLSKHNLSRLVDRLETNRYVKRHACTEDGRSNIIRITDNGEKLLKQIWPVYNQSIEKYFASKLSEQEGGRLERILRKVIE